MLDHTLPNEAFGLNKSENFVLSDSQMALNPVSLRKLDSKPYFFEDWKGIELIPSVEDFYELECFINFGF